MKLLTFISSAAASISMARAFSVTDYDDGYYHNYGQAANGVCEEFAAPTYRYDSNKGLSLYVYSGHGCQGDVWKLSQQDTCVKAPFAGISMRAK